METTELRVGHLSTLYHTCFILMQEDLVIGQKRLDVNWSLFGTGPAMVQAFKDGEIDAGYLGIPPAVVGIDQGLGIKCVAGGHVEGTILVGKEQYHSFSEESSISDVLAQFKGKVIGVPSSGSIHDILLAHALNEFGFDQEIKVKHYKQAEFIGLDLANDVIDAGCGTPALAVFSATLTNSKVLVPPDQFWEYNPSYGIFFTDLIIKNDPFLVFNFLRHHRAATELIRRDPWLASELIARAIKVVDAGHVLKVLKISPRYCVALPQEYIDASMRLVSVLRDLGYITNDLDIPDIFNLQFMEQVHPEPHHYRVPIVFQQDRNH